MKAENQKKFYVYVLSLLVMALCWGCKDDDENSLPPEPVDKEEEEFVHLDLDYLDFSAEGGTEEIDFSTSSDWEAVSLASWIKVSPSTGEKGEDVGLQLQVEENEDSAGREAKLILRIASGNTADTLTVRQAGRTRYVPVSWDEDAKLTRFDLMNGDVGIEFRGDVPVFTPGVSAIVVPTDTMSYIRVVKDISAEGSSVTLKTEEGSLTDIFMDQEFTLSITPNPNARMTRSGKLNTTDANGVIHPDKIIACMKDGSRVTLYDAETSAFVVDDEHVNLWSKTIDYSGQSLYEEEGVKLSWEKCMLSGSLDGHFYFSFISEEKALPGGLEFKTGKLNNFFCFLDGNLGLDLMLKLEAAIKESHDFSKPILSDFVNLTVPFNVGGIPFSVTIKADLIAEASFAAEAQATLSGGFNAGVGTKFGMNYINESLLPIWEPGYHFNVYPPTLEVSGTVDAQATIYPYYKIRFYNFAGPNIAYKDYLKMGAAMGARVSTDPTLNYAGWTACVYTQPELEISLALDFIGIHATSEPWTKPSETKNYLFEAPKKIELVSPQEDGRSYQIGEPIDVTFRVTGELYEKDPLPTWKAIVQANAFGGQSDKEFYQTDENGEFTVTYIPQEEGSRLGVYIVNEKGEPFAGAAFTPDLEQDKLVGQWGINAGAVMNGSEISWIDVLTFKSDGTYTYESNPSKLALYWTDANGITYSRIHYSYCSGTYVFDEAGEKLTLQASYASDVTIRDGVETPNDPQSTLVANLFGRSGVYIARIESDGRLIIIHEGWQEGITGSAFFPIDNTSRFASRSIANGVYEIGQQKFQTSQEIVYPYPKP